MSDPNEMTPEERLRDGHTIPYGAEDLDEIPLQYALAVGFDEERAVLLAERSPFLGVAATGKDGAPSDPSP